MRICLIGNFRPNLDEGFANVASNLARELGKNHEIMKLDKWPPPPFSLWCSEMTENPQIIHWLTKPSIISLWLLKALTLYWRSARTVISALHPDALSLQRKVLFTSSISMVKPDLVLVQSLEARDMFASFNCWTDFSPNGVDTERFLPHSAKSKKQLREKYGVAQEKFVILHVGHLRRNRNLQVLRRLQSGNNQVLIVASTYRKEDKKLHQELAQGGCIVWKHYFPNIEEIYALADCYLFPIHRNACLSLPLSVLEAMACNLPVVSTRFGAVPTMFENDEGLFFAEADEEFPSLLDKVRAGDIKVNTRQKVLPYSWENIAKQLEQIYREVLEA